MHITDSLIYIYIYIYCGYFIMYMYMRICAYVVAPPTVATLRTSNGWCGWTSAKTAPGLPGLRNSHRVLLLPSGKLT